MHTRNTKGRKGFSLIEVVVTIVFVTAAMGMFVYLAAAMREYSTVATLRTSEGAELLVRQAQIVEGGLTPGLAKNIDPPMGTGYRTHLSGGAASLPYVKIGTATNSAILDAAGNQGANLWTAYTVVNLGAQGHNYRDVQGIAANYLIAVKYNGNGKWVGTLQPPLINKAAYGDWDVVYLLRNGVNVKDLIFPNPANPAGTSYRYETATSPTADPPEPTASSPLWTNETFAVISAPRVIKFRAFYDTLASEVCRKQFAYPSGGILAQIRIGTGAYTNIRSDDSVTISYDNYAGWHYAVKWGVNSGFDGHYVVKADTVEQKFYGINTAAIEDTNISANVGYSLHDGDGIVKNKIKAETSPLNGAFIGSAISGSKLDFTLTTGNTESTLP